VAGGGVAAAVVGDGVGVALAAGVGVVRAEGAALAAAVGPGSGVATGTGVAGGGVAAPWDTVGPDFDPCSQNHAPTPAPTRSTSAPAISGTLLPEDDLALPALGVGARRAGMEDEDAARAAGRAAPAEGAAARPPPLPPEARSVRTTWSR
jgi:hypothetical protein